MKFLSCIFLIISVFILNLSAKIINVPADTNTIQGGINMTNQGDTVLVQPGTYLENINFNGKNIVVGSLTLITSDTSFISKTVIDGNQSGSVVTFENGEDSSANLCGFTITGGKGIRGWGAFGNGIFVHSSNPELSHLLIKNNICDFGGAGGGIYFNNSISKIYNVTIKANEIQRGAGIFCSNSDITLENVILIDNRTDGGHGDGLIGGGIFLDSSNAILENVMISNNNASVAGGGINCFDSSPSFSNVTISWNTAAFGGGISFSSNSNPSFDPVNRCNIYYNKAIINGYNPSGNGSDLSSDMISNTIAIVVDTFSVLIPDSIHANPLNKFTFDILHAVVTDKTDETRKLPTIFSLSQNYPNPFNPSTTIEFSLPKSEYVELKVYNILGKKVSTLVATKLNQGNHTYNFDGGNLASGVYYYRIEAGNFTKVRKMIYLK